MVTKQIGSRRTSSAFAIMRCHSAKNFGCDTPYASDRPSEKVTVRSCTLLNHLHWCFSAKPACYSRQLPIVERDEVVNLAVRVGKRIVASLSSGVSFLGHVRSPARRGNGRWSQVCSSHLSIYPRHPFAFYRRSQKLNQDAVGTLDPRGAL
jgi:hypothetical protein